MRRAAEPERMSALRSESFANYKTFERSPRRAHWRLGRVADRHYHHRPLILRRGQRFRNGPLFERAHPAACQSEFGRGQLGVSGGDGRVLDAKERSTPLTVFGLTAREIGEENENRGCRDDEFLAQGSSSERRLSFVPLHDHDPIGLEIAGRRGEFDGV